MSNAEMDLLEVGSVVRKGTMYRVVRHVSRWKAKRGKKVHVYVTFAIRRRSWTNRPYTVYGVPELRRMDYIGTPTRVALRSPLDRELAANIADNHYRTLFARDGMMLP